LQTASICAFEGDIMEIAQTGLAQSTARNATTSRANISSDFDTFLKMLTVQLKNQDPLNPVEATDYAVQLATFSGVEQQVQTNDLLKSLVSLFGASGVGQMASWVGKEALAPAPGFLNGAPITVLPKIADGATVADLIVRDETGQEIQRLEIGLDNQPITWAGVTSDGAPLPNGFYSFSTASYDGEVLLEESPAEVYSRVTEVQTVNGEAAVVLESGVTVLASAVTGLRER
jgi:flagellar basal-body rod modification protein FlgD